VSQDAAVIERFNAFHLQVSVLQERIEWVISRMQDEEPSASVGVLDALSADLAALVESYSQLLA
jgi:hypothetical protein